jgi:hypothetical protein
MMIKLNQGSMTNTSGNEKRWVENGANSISPYDVIKSPAIWMAMPRQAGR